MSVRVGRRSSGRYFYFNPAGRGLQRRRWNARMIVFVGLIPCLQEFRG